jgi:gluconokinase
MFILVMAVTGSGKTTVGSLLARTLGRSFYDADDYHSEVSVSKMASAQPLTDEDRFPWLQELRTLISGHTARGEDGVLACSALKASYRSAPSSPGTLATVYLKATPGLIDARMAARHGHYMATSLNKSQFEALEEPTQAVAVPVEWPPERIVAYARSARGI